MKDGWNTFRGLKDWVRGIFETSGSLKVGTKVFHPSYGEGVIEQVQGSGATARVCVNFGFAKPIVSLSELRFDQESAQPKEPQETSDKSQRTQEESDQESPRPTAGEETPIAQPITSEPVAIAEAEPIKQMNEIEVQARKGIMALRLGQVLESQVQDLSVGTTDLEQQLNDAISSTIAKGPTFLLLDAAWGAGKTHALTLLQVLARETKFATSYVVMDGVSTSLASPMELMSEMMHGLRFARNSRSSDLSHQFARAKQDERIEVLEKRGAWHIADTLSALPIEAFDDPEVLDLLSDFFSLRLPATQANKQLAAMNYRTRLKGIKASRVADRATRFVELLGEWALFTSVMGCNGLLVVMDELDVEYASSAYGTQSDWRTISRRRELLTEFRKLTKIPLLIALAAAPGDPSIEPEKDPVRDILDCFGKKIRHIKVPSPDEKDFRLLLDRLLALYGDAYDVETAHMDGHFSDQLFDELFGHHQRNPNAVTRRFVRSAIERMDLVLGQSSHKDKGALAEA